MNWLKLSALACGLVWAAPHAHAAEYPTRPIKLIVPYAAGGPTDVLGRMVGEYLGRDLKQPVVVENKAGAQGAIGAEAAARSEPDGYTLFVTAASIFVLNPMLYKKLPYDPVRDFRMLALITDLPVVMEVHPSVPAKTVAEFVAYAKQNPGKAQFRIGRHRRHHSSGRRDVQADGRRRHGPRRLQGRGPRADRPDIGQHPVDVRHARHRAAAGQVRLVAAARRSAPRSASPICPMCPTIAESGYPDYARQRLVRRRRAGQTARRHRAESQRQPRPRAERRRVPRLAGKDRLSAAASAQSQAEIDKFIDDRPRAMGAVIKALNISLD